MSSAVSANHCERARQSFSFDDRNHRCNHVERHDMSILDALYALCDHFHHIWRVLVARLCTWMRVVDQAAVNSVVVFDLTWREREVFGAVVIRPHDVAKGVTRVREVERLAGCTDVQCRGEITAQIEPALAETGYLQCYRAGRIWRFGTGTGCYAVAFDDHTCDLAPPGGAPSARAAQRARLSARPVRRRQAFGRSHPDARRQLSQGPARPPSSTAR